MTYQGAANSANSSIGAAAAQPQDAPVNGKAGETRLESATHKTATSVHCAQCKCSSGLLWLGWRAYRTDDPETGEPPAVAFFCRACAEREFGYGAD